jgi:hypothetical protein
MRTTEEKASTNTEAPAPRGKRRSRTPTVILVLVLIAAGFGGGFYWGEMRLRQAAASWKTERDKLEATVKETTQELAALQSTRSLWEIDGRVSEILADLADNNFGLARDAAQAALTLLEKAAPGFDSGLGATLAPLDGILKNIIQGAPVLSPQAKAKAREARTLIRAAIGAAGG